VIERILRTQAGSTSADVVDPSASFSASDGHPRGLQGDSSVNQMNTLLIHKGRSRVFIPPFGDSDPSNPANKPIKNSYLALCAFSLAIASAAAAFIVHPCYVHA